MSRVRANGVDLTTELELCLTIGPAPLWDDFTEEDLEVGWRIHGAKLMQGWEFRDASRPWGWWVFEQGEDPPPLEPGAKELRLAQLGEITDDECAALAKRAIEAKAKLDTGVESYVATGEGGRINFEQEAISLWERVREAKR